MSIVRKVGILAVVAGGAVIALSPRHRAALGRQLARARDFVAQQLAGKPAHVRPAPGDEMRWADDGGAIPPSDGHTTAR